MPMVPRVEEPLTTLTPLKPTVADCAFSLTAPTRHGSSRSPGNRRPHSRPLAPGERASSTPPVVRSGWRDRELRVAIRRWHHRLRAGAGAHVTRIRPAARMPHPDRHRRRRTEGCDSRADLHPRRRSAHRVVYLACTGLTCAFDASASFDDGIISSYQWFSRTAPTSCQRPHAELSIPYWRHLLGHAVGHRQFQPDEFLDPAGDGFGSAAAAPPPLRPPCTSVISTLRARRPRSRGART